jgi:phosphatidylglycerophosphate synthase
MFDAKLLADILTVSRIFIAAAIIALGFLHGAEALPVVVWLTIAAWTSDVLDGALARLSRIQRRTWIGDQDLIFDMVIGAALLIYMTAAGFVNIWLAGVYLGLSVLVFWHFGLTAALGKLFQAPAYAWFIIVALRQESLVGIWLVAWIVIALIATWPRFPRQTIPKFLNEAAATWQDESLETKTMGDEPDPAQHRS